MYNLPMLLEPISNEWGGGGGGGHFYSVLYSAKVCIRMNFLTEVIREFFLAYIFRNYEHISKIKKTFLNYSPTKPKK